MTRGKSESLIATQSSILLLLEGLLFTQNFMGCRVFGVIVGIFLATDYVSKFKSIFCHMTSNITLWTVVYIIFCIFAIGFILAGCLCWITALFARVNLNEFSDRGIKSDSLIFFSSIAKHKSLSSYKQNLKKCETTQMEEDLISQIYVCSIICDKKFKYYELGLFLASIGSLLFVTLFVIGIIVI